MLFYSASLPDRPPNTMYLGLGIIVQLAPRPSQHLGIELQRNLLRRERAVYALHARNGAAFHW